MVDVTQRMQELEYCAHCESSTFNIVWTPKGYHMYCTQCGKDFMNGDVKP